MLVDTSMIVQLGVGSAVFASQYTVLAVVFLLLCVLHAMLGSTVDT